MSGEKNPEVVGCDASIMRNVWEIREREYGLKMQLEHERIEKSALPSINQAWANRMAAKQGNYRRVEKKAKTAETQTDNNLWKSKKPQVPPALPRGAGSGPLGRQGGQSRGFSSQALNYKDKNGQSKNFNRLQLLLSITQTQHSAMVWGKSWKYNKSLPSPTEGGRSDWGQCWMFDTQQPYSEAGKPWLNGPNMMDPHGLHLWKKPDYKRMESDELDLSLPIEEWQMSWIKSAKNNNEEDTCTVNGENGYFTMLLETHHHNEALSSSEWSESWRAIKPASQQEHFTVPNNGLMIESVANKQDKKSEMSSRMEGLLEDTETQNEDGERKNEA
ncbi:uncharacterized protein AKAME5_000478500 [Lates japonicus]|uniref:Uncharacterized protein n=1 Tax=Lates japonicus TaxID=270547 RepID=A0AAD3MC11_LATJO|nr:uncharacterized protein AKAME5_000478500 [Lates japonicus]